MQRLGYGGLAIRAFAILATCGCSNAYYAERCSRKLANPAPCSTLEDRCSTGDVAACRAYVRQLYDPTAPGDDRQNSKIAAIQAANCDGNVGFASDLTRTALDIARQAGSDSTQYLERACDCDWPVACLALGTGYRTGRVGKFSAAPSIELDPGRALAAFVKGCSLGRRCVDQAFQQCSYGDAACEMAAEMLETREIAETDPRLAKAPPPAEFRARAADLRVAKQHDKVLREGGPLADAMTPEDHVAAPRSPGPPWWPQESDSARSARLSLQAQRQLHMSEFLRALRDQQTRSYSTPPPPVWKTHSVPSPPPVHILHR
jgi:hypothetical protein